MAAGTTPHFQNSIGVEKIEIGSKEFQCIGAKPPFDHPHIFLDMAGDEETICPYCSTRFVYDGGLAATESNPAECAHLPTD